MEFERRYWKKKLSLNLTLRSDPRKIKTELNTKSTDLRESLAKKTSRLETLKEDHE